MRHQLDMKLKMCFVFNTSEVQLKKYYFPLVTMSIRSIQYNFVVVVVVLQNNPQHLLLNHLTNLFQRKLFLSDFRHSHHQRQTEKPYRIAILLSLSNKFFEKEEEEKGKKKLNGNGVKYLCIYRFAYFFIFLFYYFFFYIILQKNKK